MITTAKTLLRFIDPETGPITRITSAPYPSLFKRSWWHSSAFLHKNITGVTGEFKIFNQGSGGAWSPDKEESQVKAVVEAIERWSFFYYSSGQSAGLDIDSTTNGFAALPDSFGSGPVKANAYCEALERWLLDRIWYNGDVLLVNFPWERTKAPALFGGYAERLRVYITEMADIEFPDLSDKKVFFCLALLETECGGVLPGSACGMDVNTVAEHAIIELYNHYLVFGKIKKLNPARLDSLIEARLYYFASSKSAGEMVKTKIQIGKNSVPKIPKLAFSAAIIGPWNPEVNVYRVLLDGTVPFMTDGVERFLV